MSEPAAACGHNAPYVLYFAEYLTLQHQPLRFAR